MGAKINDIVSILKDIGQGCRQRRGHDNSKLCSRYLREFWAEKISLQELERKCSGLTASQIEIPCKQKQGFCPEKGGRNHGKRG